MARKTKTKTISRKLNPNCIASPKHLKQESQQGVTFVKNIVTAVQMRPTKDNEKKLFFNNNNKKRALRDINMCPAMLQYEREYRQQRRNLRRVMKKIEGETKNENN